MNNDTPSKVHFQAIDNINEMKYRDSKYLAKDKSFIKTLLQGAVNVELFTIPLYMTSMYSIVGMHQINSKDTKFYEGRWWPGAAPSPTPTVPTEHNKSISNQLAFNAIFSVFMEEMFHLQLISNMCSELGVQPSFTSSALQSEKNAWTCYGTKENPNSVIPHIIDFQDCKAPYNEIKVELGALNENQINLFIEVEANHKMAQERIREEKWAEKYAHQAPYNHWETSNSENDLPLFGSIGKMYETIWAYIEVEYTDGTSLLDELLKEKTGQQRDQFNPKTSSHAAEYPHVQAEFSSQLENRDEIKMELLNMINAITDQGEGKDVIEHIIDTWENDQDLLKNFKFSNNNLGAVKSMFQPDADALRKNYQAYNDNGTPLPISGQAKARIDNAAKDHLEIFLEVKELMKNDDFETWDQWHAKGNKWCDSMLGEDKSTVYNISSPQKVANALNQLKEQDENLKENTSEKSNYETLSLTAVGTLKGITTNLNRYWKKDKACFPNPAMVGSGDRVSICWAIMGKAPDLSLGIEHANNNHEMFNACQGMSLMEEGIGKNKMPDVRIYHSCKTSNECRTQGGCGFVESIEGKGCGCGDKTKNPLDKNLCGGSSLKSAPANNTCGGKGGCAVPISASQLFPDSGQMEIHAYDDDFDVSKKEIMNYTKGDSVYDIAWKAYSFALETKGKEVPTKPEEDLLRIAFPPST